MAGLFVEKVCEDRVCVAEGYDGYTGGEIDIFPGLDSVGVATCFLGPRGRNLGRRQRQEGGKSRL